MKVFLPATLLFAAAATALPGKAPVPSFTPNKLPDLGEPELVPEMLIPGASGYRQPPNAPVYPFWTTPSCDMDHPHPAVEGRPWQEIQFNDINQCVNIDKWTPRSSSGYTFRVPDYSMLKNEEDAPCHIVMYQGWNCAPVRTNWGSYIMLQSRVNPTREEMNEEPMCWSHDTKAIAKSAQLYCGWKQAPEGKQGKTRDDSLPSSGSV